MSKIEFIKSVSVLNDLPKSGLPEIALAGRSNVGKSSFINTIFNRKGLAKTSSTPGKTRTLNYYKVEDKFYLVDLPGFGYAKVSKSEREYWERLLIKYFQNNLNISRVIHFIDSRHKPTQLDVILNNFIKELDIPYIVLLNKVDKLKQSELAKLKKEITEYFPELSFGDNLFLFSSVKGIGKKELTSFLFSTYS
ncbi:MAG: ribosome biogenesis GTP-binding protein YihA/YsxC [Bacteroidota bacterium]